MIKLTEKKVQHVLTKLQSDFFFVNSINVNIEFLFLNYIDMMDVSCNFEVLWLRGFISNCQ